MANENKAAASGYIADIPPISASACAFDDGRPENVRERFPSDRADDDVHAAHLMRSETRGHAGGVHRANVREYVPLTREYVYARDVPSNATRRRLPSTLPR